MKKNPKESFLDFLYNNARDKNKDDKKVVDFFSRLLNTFSNLSGSVLEIKTLLYVMCSKQKDIELVKIYWDIRKTLIEYKGIESNQKT